MNSSKKKRGRKNVVIRCRKISSTSNRSQSSFHHATPAGGYRRQIKALLKNNKSLALRLEDTQIELSRKQRLFDESSEYLNKIQFARFKILEMYEGFKSFIKNFDEVILLLKVEDSKQIEKVPSKDRRKGNNRMKKVVETLADIAENHSDDEEIVENSSNEYSIVGGTSSAYLTSHELTQRINEREVCQNVGVNDAEAEIISMNMLDKTHHFNKINNNEESNAMETDNQHNSDCIETPTSTEAPNSNHEPQEACEGGTLIRTGEKSVSPLIINSGTPNISNPQELKTNTEEPSDLETNVFIKNISQISASDISSSLKIASSKIPKPKMKTNSSGIFIDNAASSKRKFFKTGIQQSNLNVCKRKTFVIKSGKKNSEFELPVISDNTLSDQENFMDKNLVSSEDLDRPACGRKTFVVKPPVIPEYVSSSPCDRRKTFVKKTCNPVKTAVAVKNKRNSLAVTEHTSTLSKVHDNCTDQSEDFNTVEPVNIENDMNLCIKDIIFEKETSCTPILPTNLVTNSEKFQCNTENCSGVNIPKKNLSKDFDDTSSFFIAVNISKEKDKAEKIVYEAIELQNQATGDKLIGVTDLPNDIENPLEGKSEDLVKSHNISKPVSSKLFLDSSESDLSQSIPDLDVFSFKEVPPIKTPPIRRCIPKSKTERVFVFGANKMIPNKTPIDEYVSEKSSDFSKQSTTSCQPNIDSVNNIEMKNQDADKQKGVKKKKRVNFTYCDQTNETSTFYNENLDLVNKKDLEKPLAHKKKIKNKNRQKSKCGDAEIDCIASVGTKNSSNISCTAKINFDNLPVISDKNVPSENRKSCYQNDNGNNSNLKSYGNKSDALSNDGNKVDNCLKSKQSKQNSNADNAIDDDIPIPRKRKKSGSKEIVDTDALLKTKSKKSVNKASKETRKSSRNNKVKNTFLVHAEVHPVPPSLNMPETSVNKENEMQGLQNLQVSVVLNDIFGSENACKLNECEKEQLLHEGKSFQTAISDNVQLPICSSHNDGKEMECITLDSKEVISNRRRRRIVNYREPSLSRKMRQ